MKTILVALTALFFALPTSAATAPFKINQTALDGFIELAYQHKAKSYTEFAVLFNLCQQHPKHENCGDKYNELQRHYNRAKANHDALVMASKPEFIVLPLPEVAREDFESHLVALGYLNAEDKADAERVLSSVNQWLVEKQFEPTKEVYLIHSFLLNTEFLITEKQRRSEKVS